MTFIDEICRREEALFPDLLDPTDSTRIRSDRYSWLYRPSHHAETGLITAGDIEALQRGATLLSVGAYPCLFEQIICSMIYSPERVIVADRLPEILTVNGAMKKFCFDMTESWPDALPSFDLIVFPESLCIALKDKIAKEGASTSGPFPTDAREAELLAHVLGESLAHLKPGGEIRANGPQSHPNVVKAASTLLAARGVQHFMEYRRYFLTVRQSESGESRVELRA